MVAATVEKSHPLWMTRLDTPGYRVTDAARYAGLSPRAISDWFRRSGPDLPHRERGLQLSYLELIEVAFVASFRSLGVPMRDIRRFRELLEQFLETDYPFSTRAFRSRGLVCLLENSGGLRADALNRLVDVRRGIGITHSAWHPVVGSRFAQFDYDYGMVVRWHLAGRKSRVAIDPRIAFGYPMVSGLPTWVIEDRRGAGESLSEISHDFGIELPAIKDALTFERLYSASNGRKR